MEEKQLIKKAIKRLLEADDCLIKTQSEIVDARMAIGNVIAALESEKTVNKLK